MARELLNQVGVASPCHVAWSEMTGDDRVRFCKHCKLNVYNLSDMSDVEAEQFVSNATGRTCIRFFQRSDGTVLTRNCPVGAAAIRRKVAIGLLSAATLLLSAFGLAIRPKEAPASSAGGVATGLGDPPSYWEAGANWLLGKPKQEEVVMMGVMAPSIPPPPKGP